MAAARTARTRTPAPRTGRRAGGIRWDRLGRIAMLGVLGLVLYLYIGPTRTWLATYGDAAEKRKQVADLKTENVALRKRRALLERGSTLETEARKLGLVRAGEKTYIVRDLPKG